MAMVAPRPAQGTRSLENRASCQGPYRDAQASGEDQGNGGWACRGAARYPRETPKRPPPEAPRCSLKHGRNSGLCFRRFFCAGRVADRAHCRNQNCVAKFGAAIRAVLPPCRRRRLSFSPHPCFLPPSLPPPVLSARKLAILAGCMRARRALTVWRPRSANPRAPMPWACPICRFMACVPAASNGAWAGRTFLASPFVSLGDIIGWRAIAPNIL